MPDVIFPSHNAVGSSSSDLGRGRTLTETDLESLLRHLAGGRNSVISGLAVTTSGLVATVAIGEAIISGRYVKTDSPKTITLPASATRRVLLQLVKDGNGRVTGAQVATQSHGNGTAAPLADSVPLAIIQMGASASLSEEDAREWRQGHAVSGLYVGDGSGSLTIDLGATPKLVIVTGIDEEIVGVSAGLDWPVRGFSLDDATLFQNMGFTFRAQANPMTGFLAASDTWSPGLVSLGNSVSKDITVTGAVAGDPVLFWYSWKSAQKIVQSYFTDATHETTALNDPILMWAEVVSTNTVRVTLRNGKSTGITPSGTLHVFVMGKTVYTPAAFEVGLTQSYRPRIVQNGFLIAGVTDGLNQLNSRYSYVAIF